MANPHATRHRKNTIQSAPTEKKPSPQLDSSRNDPASQYFSHHARAFFLSLGQLWGKKLANSLTLLVIAIALVLPAGLYLVIQNLAQLSGGWKNNTQISLYLQPSVTAQQAGQIQEKVNAFAAVDHSEYISKEEGLKELSKASNMGAIIENVETNPLPGVIVVQPKVLSPQQLNELQQQLSTIPQVDLVQFDMAWVERWHSILELGKRVVYALAVLLGLGVVLIIGNTIYLATQSQQREIQIYLLAGASDAFIRRPYLYSGLLYGLLGAFLAEIIIFTIILWLKNPIANLANLYDSTFLLSSITFSNSLGFLAIGGLLGLLAAFAVVHHQLNQYYKT